MIRKLIYSVTLMIVGVLSAKGQIALRIDSIELNHAIVVKEKDLWISDFDFGSGPFLTMSFSIENQTSDVLTIIKDDKFQLFCEYIHEGYLYKSKEFYLFKDGNVFLSILPNSISKEIVTINIFVPYYLLEMDDLEVCDYMHGLNEVLSTIRLVLIINGKRYVSNNNPILKKGDCFFFEYK